MIEEAIAKLTAAIEANTAVLNQILASSGAAAPAPVETETPKPAKAEKSKKDKPADLKVVETPAQEPEAPADEAPTGEDFESALTKAIDATLKVLRSDRDANKPKLAALREKFGVETVKDLKPEQLAPYMAELAKL